MIEVRIYTTQEEAHEPTSRNVPALINAVMAMRAEYPTLDNAPGNGNAFDRMFEKTHGVRVIQGPPAWVIWDNDIDYTAFVLRWS